MIRVMMLVSALYAAVLSVALADDPIVFFDGHKFGWNAYRYELDYNSNGDVTLVGYKKNKKYKSEINKNNIFNIDNYNFDESFLPNKSASMKTYYTQLSCRNDSDNDILRFDQDFFMYVSDDNNDCDRWFILLLGRKENKKTWKSQMGDYEYKTYFDNDYSIKLSTSGDMYIFSQENIILYKISKNMQKKIIIRDRLVYAPVRFLANAWNNISVCPNRDESFGDYDAPLIKICIDAFFLSLPKGDYDPDINYPILP